MTSTATLRVTVEWGDCDPAEIVFYPNYFRWFDAATHNLFRTVGGGWETLFKQYSVVGVPLVESSAVFKRPSRVGDQLAIESRVVAFERKVFRVAHTVMNGGTTAVEGLEIRAWCIRDSEDPAKLRAVAIPDAVKSLFQT